MEPYHLSKWDALQIFLAILVPVTIVVGIALVVVWLLLGSIQWFALLLSLIITSIGTVIVCFFCAMAFFFTEIG